MLARDNGLVEAVHDGGVATLDTDGRIAASTGEVDRSFFLRPASKPYRAKVSQEAGARMSMQQRVLACAGHGGRPVHVVILRDLLTGVAVGETVGVAARVWHGSPRAVGVAGGVRQGGSSRWCS